MILKIFDESSFSFSNNEFVLFKEIEENFITELNPLMVRLVYNNMPM